MTEPDFLDIISKGILAPSADNLQPWRFKISGKDQLDVLLDPYQCQHFCDTANLMPYLSAGSVIENMRVAATAFNRRLDVSYFPVPASPLFVARLSFVKTGTHLHEHYAVLEKRTTNRKFYRRCHPMPEQSFEQLRVHAHASPGFDLKWIHRDDPQYGRLTKVIGEADQIRFEVERLHREFIKILRFSKKSVSVSRDGLSIQTLEAGPGSSLLFRFISSWQRMRVLNLFGLSGLFKTYAELQMKSSHAAGLIIAPTHAPADYVRGGEIMQRIWNETARLGLAMQPMEALPIFILNLLFGPATEFSKKQKMQLNSLQSEFYSLFDVTRDNGLILLFRIGCARPPKHKNLRRPPESFLANE